MNILDKKKKSTKINKILGIEEWSKKLPIGLYKDGRILSKCKFKKN